MVLYTKTVLLLLGLSYFSLSAHAYTQWIGPSRIKYWKIYISILSIIVAIGFLVFGPDLLGFQASTILPVILTGIPGGLIAGFCDRRILVFLLRKHGFKRGKKPRRPKPSNSAGSLANSISGKELNIFSAIGVGILEELIFRGILVKFSLLLPNKPLILLALVFNVVWFSLSHIEFGWQHIFSKVPLGMIALVGSLLSGTVLFAITVHVVFNLYIFFQRAISEKQLTNEYSSI